MVAIWGEFGFLLIALSCDAMMQKSEMVGRWRPRGLLWLDVFQAEALIAVLSFFALMQDRLGGGLNVWLELWGLR